MLLYDHPISGNCYKVRLLLALLGVEYERRELSVIDRCDPAAVLGELNPGLRVPTLVLDDGRSLGESGAILLYLADGTEYIPSGRFARAQMLQWMFLRAVQEHTLELAAAPAAAVTSRPTGTGARSRIRRQTRPTG